ncbi:MAG: UvrD-helicase domain-containing protein [Acidimicrobiales bacterium]
MAAPDEEARGRIRTDLGSTLFVDAGAGAGKTSELVGRALALVTSGEVELCHIAAITFTEKAAAELRDRIRRGLEACTAAGLGPLVEERCRLALEQLDGAAIGTLHSFAQRVLSQHPIEAGLPPRIEVLDEVSSNVAFEQRWSMFQDSLLSNSEMERTLLLFFAAGVKPAAMRCIALAFEQNWDLVAAKVPETEPDPPSVHELLGPLVEEVKALSTEECLDQSDKLCRRIEEIAGRLMAISAIGDEVELLEALGPDAEPKLPSFKVARTGRSASWPDLAAVRSRVAAIGARLEGIKTDLAGACARRIGCEIRRFTLLGARERKVAGQLCFHDLLVLARELVCSPVGPGVLASLHKRYERLLLDEFQDTDPIQIELAVRIAAGVAVPVGQSWEDIEVAPGRLFFVGDPKQSIYRFRRADISTFIRAEDRFGAGRGLLKLTANFRTTKPIIDWINDTFGRLIMRTGDAATGLPSQPDYLPLDATRGAPSTGPSVMVLGRLEHRAQLRADELRAAEASEVARVITQIIHEGWLVDDDAGDWRPASLGDVTVLVPSRTSLPFLEDALEGYSIPFRTESSSLVYASRPVRDLLMVLRAVDDPTNNLHIVSALRTPLFGCGDDELFCFNRERRGHWSYLSDQPDTVPVDDPVRQCLDWLRSLYDERAWTTPSELLDRIARERRAFELGFVEGRPRDVWRRLRFVIDQARAWSEATGGSLRQYLAWVAEQAADGARVAEAILPETDDDAVRIMTIHAAKGLEFPVTVLSGMSTAPRSQAAPAEVVFPPAGNVGYRFSGNVRTEEYEAFKPIDEQMGLDERIRLLYVACTRARDHLVISVHRKERTNGVARGSMTNAELLVEAMAELLDMLPGPCDTVVEMAPLPRAASEKPLAFDEWFFRRQSAFDTASLPRTVAATALSDEGSFDVDSEPDPGLQKRPRDLDLPPWLKGRYGSAVGRAVHGVLQTIDLATGEELDAAVAAQCEAEAVPERAVEVRKLVTAALASPSVKQASKAPHWREVYVCTPVGNRLLEGYLDLLYRTIEGLVVVDYKTSGTSEGAELDRRLDSYRNQGASYALAAAAATGERVVRVTFLFLTPEGAFEMHLADLDMAVGHVRELVSTGREVLVP